jgi:DNA-binding FadR family transcriptional regulator
MLAGNSRPALLRRLGHHHHRRMLKAFRAHDAKGAAEAIRADISDATRVPGYWEAVDDLGSIAAPAAKKKAKR